MQFGRLHFSGNLCLPLLQSYSILQLLYVFRLFWYRYSIACILFISTAITKYCLAIFPIHLYQELQHFMVAIALLPLIEVRIVILQFFCSFCKLDSGDRQVLIEYWCCVCMMFSLCEKYNLPEYCYDLQNMS